MKRSAMIGVGALAARAALRAVAAAPRADDLERTNFRGRPVTLAAGPALAASASVTAALGAGSPSAGAAALTSGLGAGAVGLYDDIVGARPDQKAFKGFRGHLRALRQGRVTAGLVKIAGVGAAALAASVLLESDRPPTRRRTRVDHGLSALAKVRNIAHVGGNNSMINAPKRGGAGTSAVNVMLGAGVIAGTANLLNLLDLRPGRALKSGLLLGAPLLGGHAGGLAAGPVGAAAGLLPDDLDERIMLGDSGANALGALLGVALAARTGPVGRAGILAVLVGLTAASERVSFTKVIERTAGLRELDALGRRPA